MPSEKAVTLITALCNATAQNIDNLTAGACRADGTEPVNKKAQKRFDKAIADIGIYISKLEAK